jgi:hypothetical protein
MLESLPADESLAGGGTAGERLAALAELERELASLGGKNAERVMSLPAAQAASYFERLRREGEVAALRWLRDEARTERRAPGRRRSASTSPARGGA